MKKILKYILIGAACLPMASCDDLDSLNENPNAPGNVPSNMLMEGAEKWTMDISTTTGSAVVSVWLTLSSGPSATIQRRTVIRFVSL